MTNELKPTEQVELNAEQLEKAAGGLDTHNTGALVNVSGDNTLIGLLLPAVQKT